MKTATVFKALSALLLVFPVAGLLASALEGSASKCMESFLGNLPMYVVALGLLMIGMILTPPKGQ